MRAVYSQSRERTSRALVRTAVLCLVLMTGGCMTGGPMASLMTDEDVTGSIRAPAPGLSASPLPLLSPEDWSQASKALASALEPQGAGAAVVWENSVSGARGTITPVGLVYGADGQTCRAFLAEMEGRALAQRLQGRGCRTGDGPWVVSDLKPFSS